MTLQIPNKEWAQEFLTNLEYGHDTALRHLSDVFEDNFTLQERLKYYELRYIVESLVCLNKVIASMELEGPENAKLRSAYELLIEELVDIAEKSLGIA